MCWWGDKCGIIKAISNMTPMGAQRIVFGNRGERKDFGCSKGSLDVGEEV